MIRLVKILATVLILAVLMVTLFINKSLYYRPEFLAVDSVEVNLTLLKQLHFLKGQLHADGGAEMQAQYPEGYVFMNALYGLAWCEVAGELDDKSVLYKEAKEEIQFAYNEVDGPEGRGIFDETLPLPYGAFYTGWNNYLLGKKLLLEDEDQRDSVEVARFEEQCRNIAASIQIVETPYPESYVHQSWPCDVIVGVASLVLHDELANPSYDEVITKWLQRVQATTDTAGLIPHSVHYESGAPAEYSRGCSQSLALTFLLEIDPVFARQQFDLYKQQFLDYRFGLPGLREYRKGETGPGDIDSGPIVMNIGGAATIAGLRTMVEFKDVEVAVALRNTIEALTLSTETGDEKKYLLGKLPMADAFIAWANAKEGVAKNSIAARHDWRATFQLYSLGFIVLCILLIYWTWRR